MEFTFKILMVGDLGTGKTSLIKRYVHGMYSSEYKTTIGVDFALKTIAYEPGVQVQLQLWDLMGQAKSSTIARVYYQKALGAMIVFDLSDATTFRSVRRWKQSIDDADVTAPGTTDPIPSILLGNKCDLGARAVSDAEIRELVEELGFIAYVETSAKEDIGIHDAASRLLQKIMDLGIPGEEKDPEDLVDLGARSRSKSSSDLGGSSNCCFL